ncbi:hypothetical protein Tco_0713893 [Tanacetum coccineum]
MLKQWFSSQVDVNKNLLRPVSQHYLLKGRESIFEKPDHMIASSEYRNSSKNMPRFSLNDTVHNHYLDDARKKTQEIDRNSKTSVMPSARFQSIADGSKAKTRSTNHSTRSLHVSKSSFVTIKAVPIADHSKNSNSFSYSKHFVCSTCHKCVFNANHDACITKFLKEVNSRAKIQSNKTRNSNKPVEQKSHTQKPVRQIFTGHRFSPNKTSAVYEKTSPRSDLRWKPTGRIFKTVGLRWVPTGKILASCTSKDDSDIHESKQTLNLSAGTSINVQKEQSFDLSAVVSKSSDVPTADASDKRQQQPDSTLSTSTLATTVTADENFNLQNPRSVVIQRRVKDLQLGDESYQKKLKLTKPDMYRSNLRRRDAYTPYSGPRGFIYENKDKKNRLMPIDELHKFSDGTLDDVQTALNDRLKGIRMEYLPKTF